MATKNDDEISWGKKMIKVSINFFTDRLPEDVDNKTAWAYGTINLIANKKRGLKHSNVFFNGQEEFMPKFKELLDKNGVKLLKISKSCDYVDWGNLDKE